MKKLRLELEDIVIQKLKQLAKFEGCRPRDLITYWINLKYPEFEKLNSEKLKKKIKQICQ